jgi:hypothetical protein
MAVNGYKHNLAGARCEWLARCTNLATHTVWAGPSARFMDVCDECHDPWEQATFTTTLHHHSSPTSDGPWTIMAVDGCVTRADGDSLISRGHGEAGVERIETGLWFVWGYNHETGETYLNSSHRTKAEALATAADLAAGTGYERED